MPNLLVINPKRKTKKRKSTRKKSKRKKLTNWQRAVKKYGGVKAAKKHYDKKTGKVLKRAKSRRKKKKTTRRKSRKKATARKTRRNPVKKRSTRRKKSTRRKTTKRKTTRRKSTRRKTTKRKTTRRKTTRRKSTRRKTTKRKTTRRKTTRRKSTRKKRRTRRNRFSLNPNFREIRRGLVPRSIQALWVIGGLLGARFVSNMVSPWLARWIPDDRFRGVATDLATLAVVGAPLVFTGVKVPFVSKQAKESLFVGALANVGIKLIANYAPAGMRALIYPTTPEYAMIPSMTMPYEDSSSVETYIQHPGMGTYVPYPTVATFYGREGIDDVTTPMGVDIVPHYNKFEAQHMRDMGDGAD